MREAYHSAASRLLRQYKAARANPVLGTPTPPELPSGFYVVRWARGRPVEVCEWSREDQCWKPDSVRWPGHDGPQIFHPCDKEPRP